MFRYVRWKRPFLTDAVFAGILALVYVLMRLNLNALTSELNALALASYVLLGLGTLIFYLTVGMNPNFALLVHAVLFPLLALIYVFSKWLPGIIAAWPADTSPGAFGVGLLAYVLVLMGFFVVQFSLYMLERERAIRRVV